MGAWWDDRRGYLLYPIASATYICAGLAWKPLLNWILGPLWVVLIVGVVPDAITRRRSRRAAP